MQFESSATLDIPRARKVLDHLRAHPEEHDQRMFGVKSACGTTACIAGTVLLQEPTVEMSWALSEISSWAGSLLIDGVMINGVRVEVDPDDFDAAAGVAAQNLLGLTHQDSERLFYTFDDEEALNMLSRMIDDADRVQCGNGLG